MKPWCLASALLVSLVSGCGATTRDLDQGEGPPPPDETTFVRSPDAVSVLVDTSRVYWATAWMGGNPTSYQSCAKERCPEGVTKYATLSEQQYSFYPLMTVDSRNVYWVSGEADGARFTIQSCPVEGCPATPTIVATGVSLDDWVSDGTFLYWTSISDTAVMRCPVTGCGATPTAIALTQSGPRSIVLAEPYLFWTVLSDAPHASIVRMPKDGSEAPRLFAEMQAWGGALAATSSYVYWTNYDPAATVQRCPVAGCQGGPTLVAYDQPNPDNLIADDQNVYWMNHDPPAPDAEMMPVTLMKCAHDGCGAAPAIMASQQSIWIQYVIGSLPLLALDDRYLYWVTQGQHPRPSFPYASIHRVPK